MPSAAEQRPRLRSRTRDLAERRLSLVKLLVALFVARMVVTVAPLPDNGWDRFLRPLEQVGPAVVYGLTAVFVVAALVLLVLGNPRDALLDIAVVCREITTVVFVAVIFAAYMSVREQPRPAS